MTTPEQLLVAMAGMASRSRSLGSDVDEVQRVRKLISHFHLPILTGLQFAIEALQ